MRAINILRDSLRKVSKTIEMYGNAAIDEKVSELKMTFLMFEVFVIKFSPKKVFVQRVKRSLLKFVLIIFAFHFISIIVRVILTNNNFSIKQIITFNQNIVMNYL